MIMAGFDSWSTLGKTSTEFVSVGEARVTERSYKNNCSSSQW
jgi:hypothetical protein